MPLSYLLYLSTQPGRQVVGMSWIGALLISSCITIAFFKRWDMLLHSDSQMCFRNICIDYHNL